MLKERCRQLINKQHDYAGHTKGARIRRAQEALIFDAKLEKWQSSLNNSFIEIECRKEQNRSNDTNPEQVEMGIGEAKLELKEEWRMNEEDCHTFQQRLQTEEVDKQQEQSQLKAEAEALVAEENELLSKLGGNAMTQNLSGLTEEEDEENDGSTEQKYWYDDSLRREVERNGSHVSADLE